MKRIKFLAVFMLVFALFSCNKEKSDQEDGAMNETGKPANLEIRLKGTSGNSNSSKAIGVPMDESKISSITVLVFKPSGALDGEIFQLSGASLADRDTVIVKKLTEGLRDVYVVVNGNFPADVKLWNNIAQFRKHTQLLETQTSSYLTMIGESKNVRLESDKTNRITVPVYRLCARLVAKWSAAGATALGTPIVVTESGRTYTDYFKVTNVFVMNAPQKSVLYHGVDNAIMTFDSVHGSEVKPPLNSNIPNDYRSFLTSTVNHASDNGGSVYFYTFENRTTERQLLGNTKMTLKVTYTPDPARPVGANAPYVTYYPAEVNVPLTLSSLGGVSANPLDWGVRRNTIYNVTYKISKAGVEDPWIPIPPTNLELIVEIKPWDVVDQDWEY